MIESDRNKEYKAIKKRLIYTTIQKGFVKGMYPLISVINVSTSSKWFLDTSTIMGVVLGLRIIRMLEIPITWLPYFYAVYHGYTFSSQKLKEFLIAEENDDTIIEVKNQKENQTSVEIRNGFFYWGMSRKCAKPKQDDDKPSTITRFEDIMTLKGINFKANKGEFIAVIGGVGSGKSSFIKAISGNL